MLARVPALVRGLVLARVPALVRGLVPVREPVRVLERVLVLDLARARAPGTALARALRRHHRRKRPAAS